MYLWHKFITFLSKYKFLSLLFSSVSALSSSAGGRRAEPHEFEAHGLAAAPRWRRDGAVWAEFAAWHYQGGFRKGSEAFGLRAPCGSDQRRRIQKIDTRIIASVVRGAAGRSTTEAQA